MATPTDRYTSVYAQITIKAIHNAVLNFAKGEKKLAVVRSMITANLREIASHTNEAADAHAFNDEERKWLAEMLLWDSLCTPTLLRTEPAPC